MSVFECIQKSMLPVKLQRSELISKGGDGDSIQKVYAQTMVGFKFLALSSICACLVQGCVENS